jgi:hypothetical protein
MLIYFNGIYADAQVITALGGWMIVNGKFDSTGCSFYLVTQYK